MILCVNPNPAVDRTLVIENFHLNAIQRPSFELALPGGKGCNVARVAQLLGAQPIVIGWVGGYAGQWIEAGLAQEGIQSALIHTLVESRECISIFDPLNRTMTEIYETGRPVSQDMVAAFFASFQEFLPKVTLVALSGSLPPGSPTDFYATLIQMARVAGVRTILDSSGEPLRRGLEEGRPFLLKCNRSELSELARQPLENLAAVKNAVRTISGQMEGPVIVTLGSAGAVAAIDGQLWTAKLPVIEAVSAVGSGDAFLAGLAHGITTGQTLISALGLAMACGAANTLQLGAGRLKITDVEHFLLEVQCLVE